MPRSAASTTSETTASIDSTKFGDSISSRTRQFRRTSHLPRFPKPDHREAPKGPEVKQKKSTGFRDAIFNNPMNGMFANAKDGLAQALESGNPFGVLFALVAMVACFFAPLMTEKMKDFTANFMDNVFGKPEQQVSDIGHEDEDSLDDDLDETKSVDSFKSANDGLGSMSFEDYRTFTHDYARSRSSRSSEGSHISLDIARPKAQP